MATLSPDSLFEKAQEAGASDVHIAVDRPVMFRVDGNLVEATKSPLTASSATSLVKSVIGDKRYKEYQEQREIDVSYEVKSGLRLRVNCHFERGNVGMVARLIPSDIPTVEDVGLSEVAEQFFSVMEGLILFTGPTGAGKSTSLAALINKIIHERTVHIVTMEDPVEFMFPQEGKAVVRQRQFGEDFLSFGEALKRVLRQDPDVIMVGEMRDLETIAAALTLAETGHLVFGTLHTPNTVQTIDRIIDVFPPHQQGQIRSQLSLSLKGIVAQRLVPQEGGGRTAVREILINTPAVSHIIRDNRVHELTSVLQMGTKHGMLTFESHAKELKKEKLISDETYDQLLGLIKSTKE